MPIIKNSLLLFGLVLCFVTTLDAQDRIPLSDLPNGLAWSRPIDHTDGEVYALLSSDDEGTYLVKGDSAVWMSPLVYQHLTSTTDGLRLAAKRERTNLLWPDGLVSADGLRLEALPPAQVTHTAGGVVGTSGENLYLERTNLHNGQFGAINWVSVPGIQNATNQIKANTDAMQNRSCAEASGARTSVVVLDEVWTVGDNQIISINRVPTFDRQYLNSLINVIGKSLLVTAMGTNGESIQTFTEVTGEPVSIVPDSFGFVLVTDRELVRFDSIGRERAHAYLPEGYVPLSAISLDDSQGTNFWILDEGADGRGRISQVNSSFEFVSSYKAISAFANYKRFGLRSINGHLPVVSAYKPPSSISTVYEMVLIDPTDPFSNVIEPTTMPVQLSPKQVYPLPDTLTLKDFGRGFLIDDCTLIGDFKAAKVLVDSSIWIDAPLWKELRGFSEQWLANWAPNLIESPVKTLPTGGFYTDVQGVGFRNLTTDTVLFENESDLTYASLGEVSPGRALIQKAHTPNNPTPFDDRTLEFMLYDSLGRINAYLFYDFPYDSTEVSISELGILATWDEESINGQDYAKAFDVLFTPLGVLKEPTNLPLNGCNQGGQVGQIELTWSDVPNQTGTFTFRNNNRLTGQFAGIGFTFYIENLFSRERVLSEFTFEQPCGNLVPGSINVVVDSTYPNTITFLNGEQRTFLDSIQRTDFVQLFVRDTVSGCEFSEFFSPIPRSFSFRKRDACFGQLGRVTSTSADTMFFEFADSTYVNDRRGIQAGSYPITVSSTNGCSLDTTLAFTIAPEILLTIDSALINGVYELEVYPPDTLFDYTFTWNNTQRGNTATFQQGTTVRLVADQLGENNLRCSDAVTFTLGGVSDIKNAILSKLQISVDVNGNLIIEGLNGLIQSNGHNAKELTIDIYDVNGRKLETYQTSSDRMSIQRNAGHVFGPKFLSFGKLGGIGVVW